MVVCWYECPLLPRLLGIPLDDVVRVIICGGRDAPAPAVFMGIRASGIQPTIVLCGDARGADTFGASWAGMNNIPVEHYPAEWDKHGKAAGLIRNEEMIKNANAMIAIWDGNSPGTKHAIETAQRYGLHVYVHSYR